MGWYDYGPAGVLLHRADDGSGVDAVNRRNFLRKAVAAPFVITTAGLLMPVRAIEVRELYGRSPMMEALFEMEALSNLQANRIVNPPLFLPSAKYISQLAECLKYGGKVDAIIAAQGLIPAPHVTRVTRL